MSDISKIINDSITSVVNEGAVDKVKENIKKLSMILLVVKPLGSSTINFIRRKLMLVLKWQRD